MLYVTTRNNREAVTVQHALVENRGVDGGFYVPLHFPKLSEQEIRNLSGVSFGQCVAEILNLFFSTKLTGWDIDFSVGRYPVRLEQLVHKIFVAETWHNLEGRYRYLEKNLIELLHSEAGLPGNWVSVAIRMAVLAGIIGNRDLFGTDSVDIAVVSGDFTLPISAWYLRKMGFPIGKIICCCNENNQLWDLICNGQLRTDGVGIPTIVPEADVPLPINLERLISDCNDPEVIQQYLDCCRLGSVFFASDESLREFRKGLYAGVVSSMRVETTIPNVYRTHNYILSPAAALAYSGLLDYRAKTGITRTAIVICDTSPACDAETVSRAMDISVEELKKQI